MRIISGRLKGRRILIPKTFSARPTTDYARESLFNVLENYFDFEGLDALDLFSGTGGISLEFASRGCQSVTAVEIMGRNAKFIERNAQELGAEALKVINTDVFRLLENHHATYDLIFADPPYDHPRAGEVPGIVLAKKLLRPQGWMVMEHSAALDFSGHPSYLRTRAYGKVHFSIFENPAPVPADAAGAHDPSSNPETNP